MVTEKNSFVEHFTECIAHELERRLSQRATTDTMLLETQWIVNDYINHIVEGIRYTQEGIAV